MISHASPSVHHAARAAVLAGVRIHSLDGATRNRVINVVLVFVCQSFHSLTFIGLALFLPLFNLGTSILPSAAALALPGWFKPGEAGAGTSGGGGMEVMGLRLLVGILQILMIAIAFLPVAFFGAAAWFASGMFALDLMWKVAATAGTSAFVLVIEAACGIAWLGWLFDRFDLSGE